MPGQARSTETRARLLATTAELLRGSGYHGAGLTEILDRSGVPKGSLYHHFPAGKAELAAASLRQSGAAILTWLEKLADERGTVAEAVRGFCDTYIAQLTSSDYRRGCPLATVALESADLPEIVQQEIGAAFRAMEDLLARRLAAQSPSASDLRPLATEIVAAVEGALVMAKAMRSTAPLETVRDRLITRIHTELTQESL
ncbi:MAG TPA: TetR/AcrR family transcriptional regulator [Micromonosporaceae bacterium]